MSHTNDDVCPECSEIDGTPSPCAMTHDAGPGAYDFASPAPVGCNGGHPGCTVCDAASALDERPLTLDAAIAHLEAYEAAQRGKEKPTIERRDRATVALAALVPRLLAFLRGQEQAKTVLDHEHLDAAVNELRLWLNNDDPSAPIDDIHSVVDAFDAWKAGASPALEVIAAVETEYDAHPLIWADRAREMFGAKGSSYLSTIIARAALVPGLQQANREAHRGIARLKTRGTIPRRVSMRVRCPVCPYLATGGMGRAGDPCPNGDGGVLVTDTSRGTVPVPRSVEGQPAGVIGDVWMRWNGLAASPLRTDAEEAELAHLGAMLVAVGLETWEPVPREPLPPYPGDEDPAEDPRPT